MIKNCKFCNKEFEPKSNKRVYCSDSCKLKDYKKNHPNKPYYNEEYLKDYYTTYNYIRRIKPYVFVAFEKYKGIQDPDELAKQLAEWYKIPVEVINSLYYEWRNKIDITSTQTTET